MTAHATTAASAAPPPHRSRRKVPKPEPKAPATRQVGIPVATHWKVKQAALDAHVTVTEWVDGVCRKALA